MSFVAGMSEADTSIRDIERRTSSRNAGMCLCACVLCARVRVRAFPKSFAKDAGRRWLPSRTVQLRQPCKSQSCNDSESVSATQLRSLNIQLCLDCRSHVEHTATSIVSEITLEG